MTPDYETYRDAAGAILARHQGTMAVEAFGLADVFKGGTSHLDCSPVYAFLEAQGAAGARTPALSMLGIGGAAQHTALAFGDGTQVVGAGWELGSPIAVDRPGSGLLLLKDPVALPTGGAQADDYLVLLDTTQVEGEMLLSEPEAEDLRTTALARVRLGVAAELLGITTRVLDDALTYAKTRRQFGSAIGDFQAVQHLLAWAATERHQLRCLYDIAVLRSLVDAPDPVLAATVKALAGRVAHTVMQTAIQVTGAISFTWEYSLNQLHHRSLALDQVAGSSSRLSSQLGRQVRESGVVPSLFELQDTLQG